MKKSNSKEEKKKDKKINSSTSSSDITLLFVKNWKYILQILVVVLGIVFASTLFQANRYLSYHSYYHNHIIYNLLIINIITHHLVQYKTL